MSDILATTLPTSIRQQFSAVALALLSFAASAAALVAPYFLVSWYGMVWYGCFLCQRLHTGWLLRQDTTMKRRFYHWVVIKYRHGKTVEQRIMWVENKWVTYMPRHYRQVKEAIFSGDFCKRSRSKIETTQAPKATQKCQLPYLPLRLLLLWLLWQHQKAQP